MLEASQLVSLSMIDQYLGRSRRRRRHRRSRRRRRRCRRRSHCCRRRRRCHRSRRCPDIAVIAGPRRSPRRRQRHQVGVSKKSVSWTLTFVTMVLQENERRSDVTFLVRTFWTPPSRDASHKRQKGLP